MHFLGLSTTAITDEASTGPWVIESKTYIASGTPEEGQILLKAGDAALYGKKEFVRPNGIHTNSVEGFWAHFKRVIFGTYHFVSKTYLQRYIDEQLFRWNTREASEAERFSHMFAKSIGIVRYWDVKMVG